VKERTSLRGFLTVPPPKAAGGNGPSDEQVAVFLIYLEVLANDDHDSAKVQYLLNQLKSFHPGHSHPRALEVEVARHLDLSILLNQIKLDPTFLSLLHHHDLRAIADHLMLGYTDGTKDDLKRRIYRALFEGEAPKNVLEFESTHLRFLPSD
jgi:hypothetical protein